MQPDHRIDAPFNIANFRARIIALHLSPVDRTYYLERFACMTPESATGILAEAEMVASLHPHPQVAPPLAGPQPNGIPRPGRMKAVLHILTWSIAGAALAMAPLLLLSQPQPTWLYVALGLFGAAVGPILSGMAIAPASGLAQGLARNRHPQPRNTP